MAVRSVQLAIERAKSAEGKLHADTHCMAAETFSQFVSPHPLQPNVRPSPFCPDNCAQVANLRRKVAARMCENASS